MVKENENVGLGIVGAFLGSIPGVILWLILAKLGYIAGLAGAVMAIGAIWGYGKFAKDIGGLGVIISIGIVGIMVYLSTRLSWSIEAYNVLKDYDLELYADLDKYADYTMMDYFANIHNVLKDFDIQKDFFIDLGVGYLLTIVASLSMFFKKRR